MDLVVWTLNIGCVNVGLSCMDIGLWLFQHRILVVWTLDFGCMDVGFGLGGCWMLEAPKDGLVITP